MTRLSLDRLERAPPLYGVAIFEPGPNTTECRDTRKSKPSAGHAPRTSPNAASSAAYDVSQAASVPSLPRTRPK